MVAQMSFAPMVFTMEKDDPLFQFGNELRAHRAARGWNQTELAKRAGMSRQAISNLENSRSAPQRRTLECLQKALGLPFWAMDGLRRKIVQPGPPFFIMPWPPEGITWEEVQIAIVDYCKARESMLKKRVEESRCAGDSFYDALDREAKRFVRLKSAPTLRNEIPRRKPRRKKSKKSS